MERVTRRASIKTLVRSGLVKDFRLWSSPVVDHTQPCKEFKTATSCLVTTGLGKKLLSVFLLSPLCIWKDCNQVSPEASLLQTEQPQLLQPFLTGDRKRVYLGWI